MCSRLLRYTAELGKELNNTNAKLRKIMKSMQQVKDASGKTAQWNAWALVTEMAWLYTQLKSKFPSPSPPLFFLFLDKRRRNVNKGIYHCCFWVFSLRVAGASFNSETKRPTLLEFWVGISTNAWTTTFIPLPCFRAPVRDRCVAKRADHEQWQHPGPAPYPSFDLWPDGAQCNPPLLSTVQHTGH